MLILVFKAPFLLLRYLAQNKILLILAIIGVAIFFMSRQGGSNELTQSADIPAYQVIAPPTQIAPKVISTESRVYYVARWQETDAEITLLKWWDYNRDRWHENNTPLPFKKSDIKIYNRG